MQRRLRKACIALKEQSYISYAKIASAAGFSSDMNLIIIKATAPDDLPVHEKYIQHLLKLFSTSPTSCHSFAISFTRRFGTTRCWRVALKSLFLLHRLLLSVQGNSPLWTELLWTRSNGLISLYPCNFNDASASSSSSLSYTNFIISYAHLLNETLNCVPFEHSIKLENQQPHEEKEETFQVGTEMLEMLPQLQSIIDRVMDCYPVGVAKGSFIVQSAMKHIVRDSFVCYSKFRREMVVVLDNLLHMPYRNCVAAFNIYKKASLQTNQLYEFYEWCKAKGLCGSYEYPLVEPIPYIQIKALKSFLSGMWQLTDQSSNSSSSEKSQSPSPSPSPPVELFICEGGGDERHHIKDRELFEKPLIELEGDDDDDDDSWETVLESSISFSHAYHQSDHLFGKWEMANYKSAVSSYNPFSQPTSYHGRIAHNPR